MPTGFLPQPLPENPHPKIPEKLQPEPEEFLDTPVENQDTKELEPEGQAPDQNKEVPAKKTVRPTAATTTTAKPPASRGEDKITKMVEKILSEGFEDVYKELSVTDQQAFKIKGEETAHSIRALLKETKVKVNKIFRLIYDWLKMLPGINKFFLEQEAKIKADKIASLKYHDPDHWMESL